MCATNLWAVNAAAWTPAFTELTAARLGVAPQRSTLRIASSRVRPSSVTFTLTPHMCDCRALVGRGDDPAEPAEIGATAWLAWLRDLPGAVPHVARLAVLRTYDPDSAPRHARGVRAHEVTERTLRGVRPGSLLTIDWPPDA